jgi:pimeloyl-ACP methyl ester carboxylesterase
MTVQVAGEGPPLVYLHAAGGMMWDPFVGQLAGAHTVYAPLVPGTAPGKPHDISKVDDLWDLVLIYDETIRALGIEGAPVVGPSFGGMLALELAAHFPSLFSRVVVLDPIGLWLDDHPVANWVAVAPDELRPCCSTSLGRRRPGDVHAARRSRGRDCRHRGHELVHRAPRSSCGRCPTRGWAIPIRPPRPHLGQARR